MRTKFFHSGIHYIFLITAGLLMFTLFSSVAVGKLYKYQDEYGRWHFSDTLPKDYTPPAKQEDTVAQPGQQVTIQNKGSQEQPRFEVTNSLPGPIELEFAGVEMVNMRATPPLPIHKVIPATTHEPLTQFEIVQPGRPWSYSYSTRFVIGDPEARHETGKPYLPPFSPIKEYTISQAFDGEQSHKQHPLTRYAVDIPMPAGTTIHAARSGTVMEIKTDKLSPLRKRSTHFIRILHSDGTFGLYAHLAPDSIKLAIGARINRGEPVGILAKPAQADAEAHLHFAVQKNAGMKLESIPFRFSSLDGSPVEPKVDLPLRHPT